MLWLIVAFWGCLVRACQWCWQQQSIYIQIACSMLQGHHSLHYWCNQLITVVAVRMVALRPHSMQTDPGLLSAGLMAAPWVGKHLTISLLDVHVVRKRLQGPPPRSPPTPLGPHPYLFTELLPLQHATQSYKCCN